MVSFFCQTMDNYFFNDSTKKVLIQNIQKHPCLYDSSLELYRVKAYRNKAWREVSKQCGCPGQEELCRVTWKRLKEKYKRKKMQLAAAYATEGSTNTCHWSLFPLMSFMEPFFKERKTASNTDDTNEKDVLPTQLQQQLISMLPTTPFRLSDVTFLTRSPEQNTHSCEELAGSVNPVESKKPAASKRKRKNSNDDESIVKEVLQSLKSNQELLKDFYTDPISLFYLSMAEEARRLSPGKRLRLQSQIIDLTTKAFEET